MITEMFGQNESIDTNEDPENYQFTVTIDGQTAFQGDYDSVRRYRNKVCSARASGHADFMDITIVAHRPQLHDKVIHRLRNDRLAAVVLCLAFDVLFFVAIDRRIRQ